MTLILNTYLTLSGSRCKEDGVLLILGMGVIQESKTDN